MLSGIFLTIENGSPVGPIFVTYGQTIGMPAPGASFKKGARKSYAISDDSIERRSYQGKVSASALPLANCPLDAAYRHLISSGVDKSEKVKVTLAHPKKINRSAWEFRRPNGRITYIDANTCRLVHR